ncbi:ABC transporter substrate-binding protein [Rhodococcus sp. BP-252]|uniref:ABC transporter substrate-binding protein n=1 Tax=unclassified Rhodococcus (in: high G+C Gram-positive bacteria) TaxID=192944 RepID=UPI001C9AD12A|nr:MULTISPECIES: ABC transporter substrate-binding protein [unclassified Rhodococcus (in: high G+C Gram-positive bacteria)]MBY6414049.1 ABC transporter substrate-binding protein [Rhodococcus sp. BP-320]MBY6418820.1 ABC transporter substrate-binding protein [Rhodococcus sp. BP-321]MBY6423435.1 ABC transporter substrate-binding protein [Rhodococcus sp. BP-324]MBY6428889.1 ABC transporter substrate-binding protein [Rhodococcus sp. BP-323]MBY6433895.1 ABC transporter substrate-binding protein [Rho
MTESFVSQPFSRRNLFRGGLILGAGLSLGGGLTACATPTGKPGPDTVSLAMNRSMVSLDNKLLQFDAALTVQRAVREALTTIDTSLKVQLVLADSFELVAPTQWLVHLRPGVTYSDGSPVRVEDVDTALKMYSQVSGSFVGGFFPEWPTVGKIDESTFTLDTERPVPVLDYLMSNILITPAAQNVPEDLQGGVGTGPYIVTEADRGTGNYSLARNTKYWGAAPSVESVNIRFVPDESNRVVSLRSGEVDVIDAITPDAADQLAGLAGVTVERVDGVRLNQLFYNFRKPQGHPLADARVRKALSYAINGNALIDQVMQGAATPSRGVVPGILDGAIETGEYVYDPQRARAELDALGVRDLELKIIWETGEFAADTDIMESVLQMLSAVGVRATLQQFEPGGDISTWRQGKAGDWDILGNGFPSPTGLAVTIMQGMYAGTAAKEETRDTYHGYIFPEISALIAKGSEDPNPVTRKETLAEAQRRIWETWPCLWSFVPKTVIARNNRIDGIGLRPTNSYDMAAVTLRA